jgi:pimeloyl-ACP methyl ester carboxylesterase
MDTWRSWELILPALERRHDVLAPTLPGHAGAQPLPEDLTGESILDAIERTMNEAGFETAHLVGNSLGGYLALALAARGRAVSVVAFAPAGGWAAGDDSHEELLTSQQELQAQMKAAAPQAEALLASPEGRRRATRLIATNFEHIPPDLIAHQMLGIASCEAAGSLIDHARRDGWPLDTEQISCPARIVWGTADRLLPWPRAAARYGAELPHADWVLLDGIGHSPQLDVPLEAAQLVLGFTS